MKHRLEECLSIQGDRSVQFAESQNFSSVSFEMGEAWEKPKQLVAVAKIGKSDMQQNFEKIPTI